MKRIVALCVLASGAVMAQPQTVIVITPRGDVPAGYCDPAWPKLPGGAKSCPEPKVTAPESNPPAVPKQNASPKAPRLRA